VEKQRKLGVLRRLVDELSDRFSGVGAAADLNRLRRAQHLLRQRLDLLRQRRGEHQRLPLGRKGAYDLPHLRQEAHVQHAVGFVENGDFEEAIVDVSLIHEVLETARRGDDDLRAAAEGLNLRPLPDTAVDGGDTEVEVP
jgi:hypothetical protein